MVNVDDFKLLRGFDYRQTQKLTDIGEFRVAFVTEKHLKYLSLLHLSDIHITSIFNIWPPKFPLCNGNHQSYLQVLM